MMRSLREVTTTDTLNNQVIELFDKFGRTIKTEEKDAGGNRTVFSQPSYYPINGRVYQQKDAKQQNTTYAYDLLGWSRV